MQLIERETLQLYSFADIDENNQEIIKKTRIFDPFSLL